MAWLISMFLNCTQPFPAFQNKLHLFLLLLNTLKSINGKIKIKSNLRKKKKRIDLLNHSFPYIINHYRLSWESSKESYWFVSGSIDKK